MIYGFSTINILNRTNDGHNIVVEEAFTYTTKNGEIITVPIGSKSDGASTPRLLWRAIPPFGDYWPAAVLHDYMYQHQMELNFTKEKCDSIFLEAMEWLHVNIIEEKTIYDGVHLFGGSAFSEDLKKEQKQKGAIN